MTIPTLMTILMILVARASLAEITVCIHELVQRSQQEPCGGWILSATVTKHYNSAAITPLQLDNNKPYQIFTALPATATSYNSSQTSVIDTIYTGGCTQKSSHVSLTIKYSLQDHQTWDPFLSVTPCM